MNANAARNTATDVLQGLTDESIPMRIEETLTDDEAVVHLANAYQQLRFADQSGVALAAMLDSYDSVEGLLRTRAVDVLRDNVDEAEDRRLYDAIVADMSPEDDAE